MINSKKLAEFILTTAKEMYIDNSGTPIRDWILNKGFNEFEADIFTILFCPQIVKTSVLSARLFIDPKFSKELSRKSEEFVNILKENVDKLISFSIKNYDLVEDSKLKMNKLQFEADILGTEEGLKKYIEFTETFIATVQKEGELLN